MLFINLSSQLLDIKPLNYHLDQGFTYQNKFVKGNIAAELEQLAWTNLLKTPVIKYSLSIYIRTQIQLQKIFIQTQIILLYQ